VLEAAAMVRVSDRTVSRWISSGQLQARWVPTSTGRSRRIRVSELLAHVVATRARRRARWPRDEFSKT